MKILVSFKQKEKYLYDLVCQQGDKSNFIKDALKFYIEQKTSNPDRIEVKKSEIDNILNGL
jgi:hypothetical protein